MQSRARRRRLRAKAKKKIEKIGPTKERLAKGNVVCLPNGQMKCVIPTFFDAMLRQDIFSEEPDAEDLYLALAFMMDLTERSGLFASATRSISELSFVKGSSGEDMSAAEEWRRIVSFLTPDARITIIDLLSDPRPRDIDLLLNTTSSFRELAKCVQAFRWSQKTLTKSKA